MTPIAPFSTAMDGALPQPWQEVGLGRTIERNSISLVETSAGVALEMRSSASASGVAHPLTDDADALLRWRWRVTAPLRGLDPTERAGDDYAARLYALFGPRSGQSGWLSGWRRLRGWASGVPVPATTLCYVWSGESAGEPRDYYASPFSDAVQIVVASRGAAATADGWVTVQRALADDHRRAFAVPPGPLIAIVLAADTDNSRGQAVVWFGDVELLPAPRPLP